MKNKKILILALCLFLVIAFFTKGFGLFKSNPNDQTPTGPDDFVSIPLSDITDNARWYEYDLGSSKIKFFAVRATDGTVKTGFDACDVCYHHCAFLMCFYLRCFYMAFWEHPHQD